MRKADIIKSICADTGMSRHVVRTVIDKTLEAITTQARAGEKVTFPGFGRFQEILGRDGNKRVRFVQAVAKPPVTHKIEQADIHRPQ